MAGFDTWKKMKKGFTQKIKYPGNIGLQWTFKQHSGSCQLTDWAEWDKNTGEHDMWFVKPMTCCDL